MSLQIFITPKASLDLDNHFNYLASNNENVALQFFDAARETFAQLAKNPNLGSVYQLSHPRLQSIRKWRVKKFAKYLVFYCFSDSRLEIIRIIHGSRDIPSIFEDFDDV